MELALRPWGRGAVGSIVHHSTERLVEFWPSFPIAGPNHAALIRCTPDRVAAMVQETQALAGSYGLPLVWILDPEARPADLADRLAALGFDQTEELDVLVFPASAPLDGPAAAVQIVDALADVDTFATAEAVQAAAFGDGPARGQLQRFNEARADPARHFLLVRVDGQPAGAGWATMRAEGVLLNGGAVVPAFQGRGIYRALLAARLELARKADRAGVATQARPDTSAPILRRLGFISVGTWRLFRHASRLSAD